jgi:hypothetical protein
MMVGGGYGLAFVVLIGGLPVANQHPLKRNGVDDVLIAANTLLLGARD